MLVVGGGGAVRLWDAHKHAGAGDALAGDGDDGWPELDHTK